MAETVVLEGNKREERRRRQVAKLRERGLMPAVVYGHGEAPQCITVSAETVERVIRAGERFVELKIDGGSETAMIQDLQYDYLGKDMLHVDFKRVSKDEKVEVAIPVKLHGTAPGATGGGVLEQPLHVIQIRAEAVSVPNEIEVNINELELEQSIQVSDLELPDGVECLEDPNMVVVQVVPPVEEELEEGAAEVEEQAEPERIGEREEERESDEEAVE